MTDYPYKERLAAWAIVFPRESDSVSHSFNAELLTALESALQELRERGQPLADVDREAIGIHAHGLMNALGRIDLEAGA